LVAIVAIPTPIVPSKTVAVKATTVKAIVPSPAIVIVVHNYFTWVGPPTSFSTTITRGVIWVRFIITVIRVGFYVCKDTVGCKVISVTFCSLLKKGLVVSGRII
jgi:hypothetical protein